MKSLLALLLPLIFISAQIEVPKDYMTIQKAIDAANHNDVIVVAPGTYEENLDFLGKAVTVKSSHGPEVTIIDGGRPSNPDFGSVVLFNKNEGLDSIIQGFTITNGLGTMDPILGTVGGGIRCANASPSIINNIITNNHADYTGGLNCWPYASPLIQDNVISYNTSKELDGAIECYTESNARIINNLFLGNASKRVGGIYCGDKSSPELLNNVFMQNTTPNHGGALMFELNCSPVIKNNLFVENSAGGNGGGIMFANNCSAKIINNVFYKNTANNGGACFCAGSSLELMNNTICLNTASNNAGGVQCNANSKLLVRNTIFWSNTTNAGGMGQQLRVGYASQGDVDYSDVEGGLGMVFVSPSGALTWGQNNLDGDPLFVNLQEGDLHLTFPSPCRDSGHSSGPTHDFEENPRLIPDMGADEFHTHLYYTGTPAPGELLKLKLIGQPGAPAGLFFGAGVLSSPIFTEWGSFYLEFPIVPIPLGAMGPKGALVISGPAPGPMEGHLQALVKPQLSNPLVLKIK